MSKASDDLPEPDSPVNTTSLSRGIVEVDVLEVVLARAAHGDDARVLVARARVPRARAVEQIVELGHGLSSGAAPGQVRPGSECKVAPRAMGNMQPDRHPAAGA